MKAIVVPSRRYSERKTLTKAGERKEENFLIESLVKEMKREKFFPFSDQSAYRGVRGGGAKEGERNHAKLNFEKCGLLSRYAQFLRTLSCL